MEAKKKPTKKDKTERNIKNDFAVGDRVKVNMHRGRIVGATIKVIIDRTPGKRLQVHFGKDETALIHLWQIAKGLNRRGELRPPSWSGVVIVRVIVDLAILCDELPK